MSSSFEKYQKRRLISSYFSVVISIALVLFVLGLFGLLLLNAKKVADHFKEQVTMTAYMKDEAKESDVDALIDSLPEEYVKTATFESKEEAAEKLSADIGEDFVEYLGEIPLQHSVDIRLNAEFVTPESVEELTAQIAADDLVEEVVYDQPLLTMLLENIKKIGLWLLVISGVFVFIAVLLINSSIRLSIYSKRFTIKTMQMVGATRRFIRRPFVWNCVRLGILGALLALVGVGIIAYYLNREYPQLQLASDLNLLAALCGIVLLAGVVITWLSAFLATSRFLNLRTDELYY